MSRPGDELSASQLGYVRGGRPILTDVTLTAYAGQAVAVTGPSGSGKSSLLALLAGLERPTSGEVRLDGELVRPGGSGWRLRQRFGVVLQGYGLVSVLTAAENVELVLQARGRPAAEVTERARVALERVGMAVAAGHLVEELSGGQQQRVAVARALVADPYVVLADEPTAELDAGNRQRILSLLLDEARRGRIVVLASHDREVADACDSELNLVDGRRQPAAMEPAYAEAASTRPGEGFVAVTPGPEPELPPAAWARPGWEHAGKPGHRPEGRTRTSTGSGWERPDDDVEAAGAGQPR